MIVLVQFSVLMIEYLAVIFSIFQTRLSDHLSAIDSSVFIFGFVTRRTADTIFPSVLSIANHIPKATPAIKIPTSKPTILNAIKRLKIMSNACTIVQISSATLFE